MNIRLLKELRNRYMSHGAVLELPNGMYDGGTLWPSHVRLIQTMVEDGLKKYWYPRFLLHHLSASGCGSGRGDTVDMIPHPCKLHTPTFRRATGSGTGYGTLSTPTGTRYRTLSLPTLSGAPILRRGKHQRDVDKGRNVPVSTVTSASRLLWSRDSNSTLEQSAEYFNHLAKYNQYPVVPSGRTSTAVSTVYQ